MPKLANSSNLKLAAWPVKQILANKKLYQQSADLRKYLLPRGHSLQSLGDLHGQLQQARHDKKDLATQRNQLLKDVKSRITTRDHLQGDLLERSKKVKKDYAVVDKRVQELEHQFHEAIDAVPNLIEPDTANIAGEFAEVEVINRDLIRPADPSRAHTQIAQELNLIDFSSAARVSGAGSYFLVGDGALLEQALIQYALAKCTQNGFRLVSPPSMIREEYSTACGFRPRDANGEIQTYSVRGGGGSGTPPICLTGTAEIPIAAQMSHTCIDFGERHDLRHAGVSKSFRAEAGARGTDTKGLYRVHEFYKVEMFMWTRPDVTASSAALEKLLEYQKDMFRELGLPARVIKIGPTDLGAPAYAKYDIEAWMPGRGTWGEISSASNCLDFQSCRLHTTDTAGNYVHTLNGTALAVPRIIISLIENGWDSQKKIVHLPPALHPFLGKAYLEKS